MADTAETAPAPCCDLHGRNCEPPSELCCPDCTEYHHGMHAHPWAGRSFVMSHSTLCGPAAECSSPDLSGNGP